MAERKGPISFRMDADEYQQFEEYVGSTDLSKSKVAERAAREYVTEQLEEQSDPWRDRLGRGLAILIITGYPAYAASVGALDAATTFVAVVTLTTVFSGEVDRLLNRITGFVRRLFP